MFRITTDRLFRWVIYFRRAHSTIFAYIFGIANFTVIQYYLLIQNIPFLQYIFTSFEAFVISFIFTYVPICVTIGWLDYKRGFVKREVTLTAERNPFFRDYSKAFDKLIQGIEKLIEGKPEEALNYLREAREIMVKWHQ